MPDFLSAASLGALSQWALALLGLILAAVWFFAPQLRHLRRQTPRLPVWDAPAGDSILVVWVTLCAVCVGSLMAGSLARQLRLPDGSGWISVLSVLGLQGAAVFTLALYARYRRTLGRPLPPASAAPVLDRTSRLLIAAATFCAALPVIYATLYASAIVLDWLGLPVEQQALATLFLTTDSPPLLITMALMGVVVAPLAEELVFRAGLFRILRRYIPRWAALLLSALAFAALHNSAVHFVPLALLGVIFAVAYERTGSLLVPVVAHSLFNLYSIALLLAGVGAGP